MFILTCTCGNEIFGDEEDAAAAWQCDQCGKWFDYFGCEVDKTRHDALLENKYARLYDDEES
ncbi:MAG: hypothetical protein HFH26_03060 [Clostridiaceae bacterium]|nr:hypothetical protein [Clostridiaceae bacterium]